MSAPAHYLASEAKRKAKEEAKEELKEELASIFREVGSSCSDSTSIGDAFRRIATKLET